jgi:tRNA(Arg) A34 adenosine deaminase TadA
MIRNTDLQNEFGYIAANEKKYQPSREERNYAFMAYTCAFDSDVSKGRHCAILLDPAGVIVDTFVNRYPICTKEQYSVHAEYGVLTGKKKEDLTGYTLIVVRSTFTAKHATNSRPCKECYDKCKQSGIKRVIYSKPDNEYGCIYF